MVMRPEDVSEALVEKLLSTRLPSGGYATLNEPQARALLAAVLPEAQAQAWMEGRDDGLDDLGATQTAIDFGELTNPYETWESK